MFGPLTRISPSSAILISTTGERAADGADLERVGRRDGRGRGRLGHAPSLEHQHARGVEEGEDLGVDRRGAGDGEAQAAAEQRTDLREDLLVGELVLRGEDRVRALARALEGADLAPHIDRALEDSLLQAALLLDRGCGRRVDLLEDAGDRREVGRPDLGEVREDLQRIALPVGDRGAEVEAAELDQQRERVRERQEEVGDVLRVDDAHRVDHVEHRAVVAVRDHAALRRSRGARGVDEGADVVGGDRAVALLPGGGVAAGAALGKRREREGIARLAGHPDHVLEHRDPVADPADLVELLVVLDDTATESEFSSTYWHSSAEFVW